MGACRGRARLPRIRAGRAPGRTTGNGSYQRTDGLAAAGGGAWEPRDPEGYLSRLRGEAPGLDDLAVRYVREALRAFNARCYLACSVMLGVASEQAFRGLAEAFVAVNGEQDGKLSKLLLNPRSTYATRFEEFRRRLDPLRSALPHDLADVLTLMPSPSCCVSPATLSGTRPAQTSTRTPPACTCRWRACTCGR